MKIAVIDADLIRRKKHRFPNLCCMKISGYFKASGHSVKLKTNYDGLNEFDKVFVAKVFTDTPTPQAGMFGNPLDAPNVIKGGTGFFFDKAPPLPDEIEHSMPDYHLYDGTCDYKTYTDYSIGYLTRGCFRHCSLDEFGNKRYSIAVARRKILILQNNLYGIFTVLHEQLNFRRFRICLFCINRRSNAVVAHSPLAEFYNPTRKKICLLDDNFFGFDGWRELLLELRATGKPFVFKQGLDIRLLDEERAKFLFSSRYDGDFIFAFDNAKDAPLIEEKIQLIGRHLNLKSNRVKFYVLCGFDRTGRYNADFWTQDVEDLFRRCDLLKRYDCLPYVMRHKNYLLAPEPRIYTQAARWANQPQFFVKKSFAEFLQAEATRNRLRRQP